MSSGKRADAEKVEAYTRALLEAARSEGRANSDLVQWQHAKKFTPEVLETLAAMQREDDLGLIEQVAKHYKELLDAQDTTVSVTVTTAVPMDDALRAKVRAKTCTPPSTSWSAWTRRSSAASCSRFAASATTPRCARSSPTSERPSLPPSLRARSANGNHQL